MIGLALIPRELRSAVLQIVHAQLFVESHLIGTVLPLHLAVVAGRGDTDAVVLDPHILQRLLKQSLVLCFDHQQSVGELAAVVGLNKPYGEWRNPYQLLKEVFGAVGAAFFVHIPECPAAALVFGCELVILPPIRYAVTRHILYVGGVDYP